MHTGWNFQVDRACFCVVSQRDASRAESVPQTTQNAFRLHRR